MRIIKGIFCALMLGLLMGQAMAEDGWKQIGSDGSATYFMDPKSVKSVDENRVTFETLAINQDEHNLSPDGAMMDYIIMQLTGDCREGAMAVTHTVAFDVDNNIYTASAVSEMLPVDPQTVEEAVLLEACRAAGKTGKDLWYRQYTLMEAMAR